MAAEPNEAVGLAARARELLTTGRIGAPSPGDQPTTRRPDPAVGRARREERVAAGGRAAGRFESREGPHTPTKPEALPTWRRIAVALLFPTVVGLVALGLVVGLDLDPGPDEGSGDACEAAQPGDTLTGLAWRSNEDEATAQLARWDRCDAEEPDATPLREQATDALTLDWVLIGWLVVSFAVAIAVLRKRQRWHTAAWAGALITVVYVAADVVENRLLRDMIDDGTYRPLMPTVTAVKFGAVVGAAALVVVAAALLAGGSRDPRPHDVPRRSVSGFARRWLARLRDSPPAPPLPGVAAEPPTHDRGGVGISCSGGGIRSAAFTLGALQSLDEPPSVVAEARWMTAVSGGSYQAAAWVTGRDGRPDGKPPVWSRRSPEEDHLRRNSSYLAPGVGGKIWALTRFVFGFIVNLGVVVAALAVLAVPAGWLISRGADPAPVSGDLALPAGGCFELQDDRHLIAVAGESVDVGDASDLTVGDTPAVPPPDESDNTGKVEIEGEGSATLEVDGASSPADDEEAADVDDACAPPADDEEDPAEEAEAADEDDLPADVVGQVFPKEATVPVVVDRPVTVDGRVAGCVVERELQDDEPPCSPADATDVVELEDGRLVGAPIARLTIEQSALVEDEPQTHLVGACSDEPCLRWAPGLWIWIVIIVPAALAGVLGVAVLSIRRADGVRRRLERLLRLSVGVAVSTWLALWLVPVVVVWLVHLRSWLEDRFALVGASTLTLLLALLAQLGAVSGKSDSPAGKAGEWVKRLGARLRPILVKVAAVIVGPLLLIALTVSFLVLGANDGYEARQLSLVLACALVLVVIGLGGDLNEWSLHPFYKERLRHAFAVDPRAPSSPFDPLPDPRDDPLADLNRTPGPDLVVCAAANIADNRLTAPGRPAVSWTFTRDAIGSQAITSATLVGTYKPTDLPTRFDHLASTWTAVAVSGAAFSPAMGKMSRPERMLFALGNLRLGVWYPNPRYRIQPDLAGVKHNIAFDWDWYRTHHPRPWYLAKEALGLHRLRDPWVYVTDGGHYENLGLLELVRRQCTEIYCFDASGDQPDTFGTLSDAMRLARAELDVEIDIRPTPMKPREKEDGISRLGVWPGLVRYPGQDQPGWIVVAKLAVPRTAPFDIVDLARTLPSFPAHPTGDQLYTDQKFEAYRALGHHLGAQARMVGGALRALLDEGWPVEDAVLAVQQALCELPDPTPCNDPSTKEEEPREEASAR